MNISTSGLSFIAAHEGFSEIVYNDSAGYPSVGYGHRIIPQDEALYGPLERITTEMALQLLHDDVETAEDCVNDNVTVDLSQNQFDALVDFTYNCGSGNFEKSTLLKLINNEDFLGAANEFEKWDIAGGVLVQGLENRRIAEKELFLKV